jgi:4-hydroxy-tetrahydrodipicolinate reductase
MEPIRVSLVGASGRMGQAVQACARRHPESFALVGLPGRGDNWAAAFEYCDVVIDFSLPETTDALLDAVVSTKKPLVVGTTGHDAAARAFNARAAHDFPLLLGGQLSNWV